MLLNYGQECIEIMQKNIEIRNSTAEFLIFMLEGKEDGDTGDV